MSLEQQKAEDFVQTDLDRVRHSAAHIMAQALKRLYPDVKLGIGPAIKDGFYYDIDMQYKLTEDDLRAIEKEMRKIIQEKYVFERSEMSKEEALKFFRERGDEYKCEIIESITDETVSTYQDGEFIDLCRGPHVENTGDVKAIKLLSLAGAYWRGSEQNNMMQRVYGTAFSSEQDLKQHVQRLEEAKKRDHRKLGKELDLFSFHEESPGMVFFHSKGYFIFNTLIEFMRQKLRTRGYQEVSAPAILTDELWKKSGHYDNFSEAMYFTKAEDREYAVKPMNCPGHVLLYRMKQHSYRELPLRMAEFGQVHRYERSGVTHGLLRVRAFTQDDAHHFCMEDQLQDEISSLIELTKEVYETFSFKDYRVAVSTRPAQAIGSQEVWDKATAALKQALEDLKIPYEIHEGEGAFYGPKIEFVIFDDLGRPWQCGTIQVDFSMPERFDLEYVASDRERKRPVMIHRAIYGSIERFLGILIEHYGGVFPVWLAPVQVKLVTISEKHADAALTIFKEFQEAGLRVEIDIRPEKIGKKIRESEKQKIPYIAVIGDKEVETGTVALRGRGRQDLGTITVAELKHKINEEDSRKE